MSAERIQSEASRRSPRLDRVLIASAAIVALAGCYRSNLREGSPDDLDGSVRMDAVGDAARRIDAPSETPDARPPSTDAGCEPRTMVLERRWPGPEAIDFPSRVHVTSAPLVLPPSRAGGAARLAFVSHGELVDATGATNVEGPRGDGRMQVELGGVLRIVDLDTGETVSWGDPPLFTKLAPTATLAAGDLDGDGELEVVALGAWGHLHAFDRNGELRWSSRTPPFPPFLGPSGLRPLLSVSGAPAIADLDGDGSVEIVFGNCVVEGATGERRFCIEGEELAGSQAYWGPISSLADLDGDGRLDVLAGRVAFTPDGDVLFRLHEEMIGFSAHGEVLRDNPGPEVVLVRRSRLYLLHPSDGRVLWEHELTGAPALFPNGCPGAEGLPVPAYTGGPPLLVDVDADGQDEIAVANWGELLLLDPECSGCARQWSIPIHDSLSAVTAVSAADLDDDGVPEIVHADSVALRVIDARSGTIRHTARSSSRTRTEFPVIADVDGDDSAEIVVASSSESCHLVLHGETTRPGIRIYGERYDRWVDVPATWTQHIGDPDLGRRAPTLGPGAPFDAGCP